MKITERMFEAIKESFEKGEISIVDILIFSAVFKNFSTTPLRAGIRELRIDRDDGTAQIAFVKK